MLSKIETPLLKLTACVNEFSFL